MWNNSEFVRHAVRLLLSGFSPHDRVRQSVHRFRPLLESLEQRALPASITVNSWQDSNTRDAIMTLREAILVATASLPFRI
jgi:hypothetical protein